jgi:uncharacterized protein YegJ (DUF2314 family)
MKPLTLLVLLCILTIGCAHPEDPVISVSSDDKEMNAAIAKAKASVDMFLTNINSKDVTSYSIKVPVTDHGQTEHFWLADVTYANGVFTGKIDNDSELVKNVKLGQKIEVKKEDISDWLYMKGDKMYGNYTVRVLIPKMSQEDADKIRAMLAD